MAKLKFNEITFEAIKSYMDEVGATKETKQALLKAMTVPVYETEQVIVKDENGDDVLYTPVDKDGNPMISKKTGKPIVRKRFEMVVKTDANGKKIQKKEDGKPVFKKDLIEAKKWFRNTYPDAVEGNKGKDTNSGDIFDDWF